MSISGVGSNILPLVQSIQTLTQQLDDLQRQLATGQKSSDFAGLGPQSGVTVGFNAQVSAINAYSDTITNVQARISIANTVLTQITKNANNVKTGSLQPNFSIDSTGQTNLQKVARDQFDDILGMLNTQGTNGFLFSGTATNKQPIETSDHIFNGNGPAAGLKQLIRERNLADLGTSGLGRLLVPAVAAQGAATIVGVGATLAPDGATLTGTQNLSPAYTSASGGTLVINGTSVQIASGDDATAIQAKINAVVATTTVTASLDASNHLVLSSANAIAIGNGSSSSLLQETGLTSGVTPATDLLTQNGGIPANKTLSVTIGATTATVTFGSPLPKVSTLAQLQAQLTAAFPPAVGTVTVDPKNGNLTVNATAPAHVTDSISIGGTVDLTKFGIHTPNAAPAAATLVGAPLAAGTLLNSLPGMTVGDTITIADGINPPIVHVVAAADTVGTLIGLSNANFSISIPGTGPNAGRLLVQANNNTSSVTISDNATTVGADIAALGFGVGNTSAFPTKAVTVSEEAPLPPFGFKLASVNSSLTGTVATGPGGLPATISVLMNANPKNAETITYTFKLPDGSTENLTLEATTASPAGPNKFTIDPLNPANTAANLQATLTSSVSTLAHTALSAASAETASSDFFSFDATHTPLRVSGPPFDTATTLVRGTPANTVFWYTGENGATSARSTATAQIDPSINISYGLRANEEGIRWVVQNVAVFAATTYSTSDPNAKNSYLALNQRITNQLDLPNGVQGVADIQASLANTNSAAKTASDRHAQAKNAVTALLQSVEGISEVEVGSKILALQTSLQASLQTTARISQLSLVNYLSG